MSTSPEPSRDLPPIAISPRIETLKGFNFHRWPGNSDFDHPFGDVENEQALATCFTHAIENLNVKLSDPESSTRKKFDSICISNPELSDARTALDLLIGEQTKLFKDRERPFGPITQSELCKIVGNKESPHVLPTIIIPKLSGDNSFPEYKGEVFNKPTQRLLILSIKQGALEWSDVVLLGTLMELPNLLIGRGLTKDNSQIQWRDIAAGLLDSNGKLLSACFGNALTSAVGENVHQGYGRAKEQMMQGESVLTPQQAVIAFPILGQMLCGIPLRLGNQATRFTLRFLDFLSLNTKFDEIPKSGITHDPNKIQQIAAANLGLATLRIEVNYARGINDCIRAAKAISKMPLFNTLELEGSLLDYQGPRQRQNLRDDLKLLRRQLLNIDPSSIAEISNVQPRNIFQGEFPSSTNDSPSNVNDNNLVAGLPKETQNSLHIVHDQLRDLPETIGKRINIQRTVSQGQKNSEASLMPGIISLDAQNAILSEGLIDEITKLSRNVLTHFSDSSTLAPSTEAILQTEQSAVVEFLERFGSALSSLEIFKNLSSHERDSLTTSLKSFLSFSSMEPRISSGQDCARDNLISVLRDFVNSEISAPDFNKLSKEQRISIVESLVALRQMLDSPKGGAILDNRIWQVVNDYSVEVNHKLFNKWYSRGLKARHIAMFKAIRREFIDGNTNDKETEIILDALRFTIAKRLDDSNLSEAASARNFSQAKNFGTFEYFIGQIESPTLRVSTDRRNRLKVALLIMWGIGEMEMKISDLEAVLTSARPYMSNNRQNPEPTDPARQRESIHFTADELSSENLAVSNNSQIVPTITPEQQTALADDLENVFKFLDSLPNSPETPISNENIDQAFMPALEKHAQDNNQIEILNFVIEQLKYDLRFSEIVNAQKGEKKSFNFRSKTAISLVKSASREQKLSHYVRALKIYGLNGSYFQLDDQQRSTSTIYSLWEVPHEYDVLKYQERIRDEKIAAGESYSNPIFDLRPEIATHPASVPVVT